METDKDSLVVTYGGDLIDEELDKKLIKAVKEMGYEWQDSGYDLTINQRDLRFTKSN